MSNHLVKGNKIKLEDNAGAELAEICVGCSWGAVVKAEGLFGLGRKVEEIDLDLSAVMYDADGSMIDHIYSPLYRLDFLRRYGLPQGKVHTRDNALHHSGDDHGGASNNHGGKDNEVISVDLAHVDSQIRSIFFFLNNCGEEDFSQIPGASIRVYTGSPSKVDKVLAVHKVDDVTAKGCKSLIMGELRREDDGWYFYAIGDAYPDENICETIGRITNSYTKKT